MDPDQHRFDLPERDSEAEERADGCGEGNCGVAAGDGDESDREEALDRGVREDDDVREGCFEDGDGAFGCVGYEPSRDRFESCWGPSGYSGGSETKRGSWSPERKEFSIWSDDDDDGVVHDGIENKDLCELAPVLAPPLAAVAPADVIMDAEEPSFGVGVGLSNLGNTCFLNSVLQCLVRTAPLRHGLCMIDHYSPCYDEEFCLICCLRELVHRIFTYFDEIAPYPVAANLKYFSPDFMRYRQEDAHEFLQCMLDKLEKYPMLPSNTFYPAPSRNLVKEVFGGSLVSRLQCSECSHISCTPEDLIDFSLEIDDANTLEGALDSFTKSEIIEDIKLTCDGCNEKVLMEKQFVVDQTPLIASFHLKRFKNDGVTVEKIGKHIEFPLTLNLHPYTMGHPEHSADLIYDLYAVVVHDGLSSDSGHYYCLVRSSPSTWHEFDDSVVTRVSEYHVLSRDAYILFYARRGTSWFSNYNDVHSLCYPDAHKYSPNSVLEKTNQSSESDSSSESLTMRFKREKGFSKDSYRTAPIRPQLLNVETKGINDRHGEYSNLLDNNEDDKNDVDMEDSSFNFDMLLNEEDKVNRNETDVTISSLCNFYLDKDEANNNRKKIADKSGSSFVSEENKEATGEQTYPISSLTDNENVASSSVSNKLTINPGEEPTKLPNNLTGSGGSPGATNKITINNSRNKTKPVSCQTGSSGSPEATKLPNNTVQRKRPAERPIDNARQVQVLKTLKRTNMPMTRARKFLAAMNGSPIKKKKKISRLHR